MAIELDVIIAIRIILNVIIRSVKAIKWDSITRMASDVRLILAKTISSITVS